jgi:hypothetical protein
MLSKYGFGRRQSSCSKILSLSSFGETEEYLDCLVVGPVFEPDNVSNTVLDRYYYIGLLCGQVCQFKFRRLFNDTVSSVHSYTL